MFWRSILTRTFVLLVFALPFVSKGQTSNSGKSETLLSDSARISLLTCSPGDELYSIFGHSAIRVSDPLNSLDVVFNYGTFDFYDPNFYPNFVRGHLNYILSAYRYFHFEEEYIEDGRWVYSQDLNITKGEKQHLFDSLLINYRPENRYYPYDFFADNCATRIRDIFVKAIPRKTVFDYSSFEKGKSFRELLMPYLKEKPWSKLGINLLLGLPADKTATPWDYMYLPDHLQAAFMHASFVADSGTQPFAQQPKQIVEGRPLPKASIWTSPVWAFVLVLLIAGLISLKDLKRKSQSFWFDRLLWVVVGLLGALFTFLWVGTAHRVMVWNLNLLWANPIHLIAIFFISSKRFRNVMRLYFKINLGVLVLVLVAWPFLPQTLPLVIYPVVLALALRMFVSIKLSD